MNKYHERRLHERLQRQKIAADAKKRFDKTKVGFEDILYEIDLKIPME